MLKSAVSSFFKAPSGITAVNSVKSLTAVPQNTFVASKKSRGKKMRDYVRRGYTRILKLKFPNLREKNLTFPMNLTFRVRHVWRPKKKVLPKKTRDDYIDFRRMTGNEVLLNLENSEYLNEQELASGLFELSQRKAPEGYDWNEHPWVQKIVGIIKKKAPQFNQMTMSTISYACHKLDLKDELLWRGLEKECDKLLHRMKPRGFAAVFIAFMSDQAHSTQQFRQRLVDVLPLSIRGMHPASITNCFILTYQNNLQTQYLFDDHFLTIFWRRRHWFGARNYVKWIRQFAQIPYNDEEFWNDELIPSIYKFMHTIEADVARDMIEALNFAREEIPSIDLKQIVPDLEKRIDYALTTQIAIENSKFINVVKNDIEYYKQRERIKLRKERESRLAQEAQEGAKAEATSM